MADDGEVVFTSVKDRIAAMKPNEVGRSPVVPQPHGQPGPPRARPPPPAVPARPAASRVQSTNVPPVHSNAPTTARHIGNQPTPVTSRPILPPPQIKKAAEDTEERPSLPARPSQESAKTPPLPPRTPSEHSVSRRDSIESVSSVRSGQSSFSAASTRSTSFSGASRRPSSDAQSSRVKAPPFDPSKLPVILAKKEEEAKEQARAPLKPTYSAPNVIPKRQPSLSTQSPPPLPTRPPLPARPSAKPSQPVPPKRSALDFTMNRSTETPPPVPAARPASTSTNMPPPIPLSSRPDLTALQASKPSSTTPGTCLKCRDFSAADTHAIRFPRESLPTHDLAWLASQLTSPFPSPTDKARALFTWLHHNIAYNVADFSAGTIKPSTPASTLASGLAVCEGYAGLFAALAMHAGLEAIVVGGNGKGTGYAPPSPTTALPPPNPTGHAWNAVRIDGGAWKLIDCCWGAGAVNGKGCPYVKRFAPEWFTMSNEEFGEKHFPEDGGKWFRSDGRRLGWEEYLLLDAVERPVVYTGVDKEHGLGERTFLPREKKIRVHDPTAPAVVRFQFGKICEHWDHEGRGLGKPYLFLLKVGGRDGRAEDYLPFEFNGQVWWVDCLGTELGAPGMQVFVYTFRELNGRDMRGATVGDWEGRKRCINGKGASWGFGGVAMWELV
ncbi:hypothetical protein H2201_005710 [Coniosporium apollinis]|uniref:Transglutaminase-like domain-containing protein n=1 Tax=Coniosporium apollinis TaxID=61459 RepID=A0ABQ9NP08_9PEZI|nr:hypothetical protein H2201_005710 [Coniosporium apollinis]